MSMQLEWWDSKWNEADPRITALKEALQNIEARGFPIRTEILEAPMQKSLLYNRVLMGILLKKITQDEAFTILTMLAGVDVADRELALELIEKKLPSG